MRSRLLCAIVLLFGLLYLGNPAFTSPPDELSAERYLRHVEFLASDALKGRGNGSPELDRAAQYIASEFDAIGLSPAGDQESYFQEFEIALDAIQGPAEFRIFDTRQENGKDFAVAPISASGFYEGPLVFAGYGITAPEFHWDDYAGIDVSGKAALIFLHGADDAEQLGELPAIPNYRTTLVTRIRNARQHGAKAVIVVTEPNNHANESDLIGIATANMGPQDLGILALHASGRSLDPLFVAAGKTLSAAQRAIDTTQRPQSFELRNSVIRMTTDVRRNTRTVKNVLAAVTGSDPDLKHEWIVIGAHYDHVGLGGEGRSVNPLHGGRIHHGADDNASGTAGILELARRFDRDRKKLRRSVLFIAFAGEELGLLGSNHFVERPSVPLSSITLMINLDMIGRLANDPLNVFGTNAPSHVLEWVRGANRPVGLTIAFSDGMTISSDHIPFNTRQIPTVSFFSGIHVDYHSPFDTADRINVNNALKILSIAAGLTERAAAAPTLPTATWMAENSSMTEQEAYFGPAPTFSEHLKGFPLANIQNGSPAAQAGFEAGDLMVEFAGIRLDRYDTFPNTLGSLRAGDMAAVIVKRNGKSVKAVVTLTGPPPTLQ